MKLSKMFGLDFQNDNKSICLHRCCLVFIGIRPHIVKVSMY